MTLEAVSPWEAAARLFEPSPMVRQWATPGEMARALDPTTIQTKALDHIDQALVDVADGRTDRLMISVAPQEGKASAPPDVFRSGFWHRIRTCG